MALDRRRFMLLAGALAASPSFAIGGAGRVKAVVFDGLAIFDARPVAALAEVVFPGHGPRLMAAWRARQFEYQWLCALSGHYADFAEAMRASLVFAARSEGLALKDDDRRRLLSPFAELPAWPDVAAAVAALRESGLRLGLLSNMTRAMLTGGLRRARLEASFEHVLSTDAIRSYKPAPVAYRLATNAFGLEPAEILFVAFAGWDVAGAKWFGHPTYWLNRLDAPAEELGPPPDAIGGDMRRLLVLVARHR